MAKWNKVGSIRKSKKGSLYFMFDADVTVKKGSVLQIQNPRDGVAKRLAEGKMTEEEANKRLASIPEFIRQEVFLVEE